MKHAATGSRAPFSGFGAVSPQPPDVVEPAMAEEHGPWAHNPSPLHASPRIYGAGDGSGGKQSKDPRYRRCG